jgi:serine/threonine-protein kinase
MSITALGRYQIREEIGRGNMGVVYRGHDPVIDRPVALKTIVLPESTKEGERQAFLERFFQEARTAGKLIHPHIVVTYDAALDEPMGAPFIAMELIDGESLGDRLRREARISWQQALEWVIPLAQALHQAHQQGIVHRDIKPANIMTTRQGVPKITDFGIAKLPTAHLTQTGVVMGTPYFMSPEQLRGEPLDGRSDLFSLGVLLYNLVTGTRPFEGVELAAIASQVLYKDPRAASDVVPEVPATLDGVIARALMKAPGERYATGDDFAKDLASVRNGLTPAGAASVGARTQQAKLTVGSAAAARPEPPATVEPGLAPIAIVEAVKSAGSRFLKGIGSPLSTRNVALALVVVLLATLFLFREEIAQQKLYFDATRAAKNGQLELGEQKLEELLDRNPDSEKARDLVLEISARLVLPALPVELTAEHQHRFGSCTGRLTLREDGLEYGSKSHGRWQWGFGQIRDLDAEGSRRLAVQTHENDMLGLLDRKNYNFSVFGDPVDPAFWKRYERLFLRGMADSGSP